MSVIKLLAAAAVALLFALALASPWNRTPAWAQVSSNAYIEPRNTPFSAPTLAAPVQPQGLPSLVVAPTPAAPTPTPAVHVFNCSCYGPGTGTHWMGQLQASSFFSARQTATSDCLTYNLDKAPESPFIPPNSIGLLPSTSAMMTSGGAASAAAHTMGLQSVGAASSFPLPVSPYTNFSTPAQMQMCSVCTCN
ncbi:MAG: hypothetical protein ACREQ4_17610 [Candidatus Binataceae bacterium]